MKNVSSSVMGLISPVQNCLRHLQIYSDNKGAIDIFGIKRNNIASRSLFEGALWIEPALSIELYADRFGVLANNDGKTQAAFCCTSSFMAKLWEAWVSLQTRFPY